MRARRVLSSLHLSAAVVFLTIAIPLKAHGRWLTIGWLVEGAALLWASRRVGSKLLRVLALICLLLGLAAVLAVNPDASTVPIFNQRFGTHCVAIAVFVFVAWLARNAEPEENPPRSTLVAGSCHASLASGQRSDPARHRLGDPQLLVVSQLARQHGTHARIPHVRAVHLFGVLHGVRRCAAGSSDSGVTRPSCVGRRWCCWRVAIGKVFLVDISALSQGFRILSFLGLGALLLAVSFVYQRDWLNLRSAGGQPR